MVLQNWNNNHDIFVYPLFLITFWSLSNHAWENRSCFPQKTQGLVSFPFILFIEPHTSGEGPPALWEEG